MKELSYDYDYGLKNSVHSIQGSQRKIKPVSWAPKKKQLQQLKVLFQFLFMRNQVIN